MYKFLAALLVSLGLFFGCSPTTSDPVDQIQSASLTMINGTSIFVLAQAQRPGYPDTGDLGNAQAGGTFPCHVIGSWLGSSDVEETIESYQATTDTYGDVVKASSTPLAVQTMTFVNGTHYTITLEYNASTTTYSYSVGP